MKKKVFHINIPEPCHEGWQNMTPTDKGAFCASCQKEVIDFTQKTPAEIANYFENKKGKSCGRFYIKQLHEDYTYYEPQKQNNLKYVAGLALGLLVAENSFAQDDVKPKTEMIDTVNQKQPLSISKETRIYSGMVKDEKTGETLIGVNVIGKGTSIGTVTDIDGKYVLELPKDVTKMVFTYVGYKNIEKSILSLSIDVFLSEEDSMLEGEILISRNPDSTYSLFQQQNSHWRKKKRNK